MNLMALMHSITAIASYKAVVANADLYIFGKNLDLICKHSALAWGSCYTGRIMIQYSFVHISNNTIMSVYVVVIEEVENYYECFKYGACMNLEYMYLMF